MATEAPEDLRGRQRRGRVVIVAIIAAFLVACLALGILLWQRTQAEDRLAELTAPGLASVGVPPLEFEIDELAPLENNRGLVTTYLYSDGEPVTQLRLLNLRAGSGMDLCAVLVEVEPSLGDDCEVTGLNVSARATGPDTFLEAEGQLRAATLVVLVGHPANLRGDTLRALVEDAELMTVEDLAELAD